MRATQWEFRYRFSIISSFFIVGFLAPWLFLLRDGPRSTTWLWLSFQLSQSGWVDLSTATIVVTSAAILSAALGAWLRFWGSAYLGAATVHSNQMHAIEVMDAGPFAHLRNPLYVGAFFTMLAISILMPPSGAAFCIAAYVIFIARIIGVEKAFLTEQIGSAYAAYCKHVPAVLPKLFAKKSALRLKPEWLRSLFDEFFGIAVTACFAIFAWRYNAQIMTRAMIICFGGFLILRAIFPPPRHDE